jgi:hypothetical protein
MLRLVPSLSPDAGGYVSSAMAEDEPELPPGRAALAEQIVRSAWRDLPAYDRELLQNIGASQWQVTTHDLGRVVDDLLRSAGHAGLRPKDASALDDAVGVWIAQLRLVLINAAHHALEDLDDPSYEAMLARIAWHEWAHALSVVRATRDDIADGERLLALAPDGVADVVRRGGYRRVEYTHELVAEIYALLMSRRRRGQRGQPSWLGGEIYDLVRRVSGWSE